jgi:D-alanyl-lipoteichoic acid acyltransferase DltB (MBOAT superfamily)
MLFNSYEFIFIFLPATFLIYFLLNSKGLHLYSKVFIAFASLAFYSWWNIIYLPLLLASIVFNFIIGIIVSKKTENNYIKKVLLVFGIIMNILLLGYFKYMDFL